MINQKSSKFLKFCLQWSSLALLYYDYALTFPDELKYIWKQRVRPSTLLYIGCRYALLANLLYMIQLSGRVQHTDRWLDACSALGVVGRACILTVWTLRTWAVWSRSIWILILLVPILIGTVLCDIISATPIDVPNVNGAMGIQTIVVEWLSAILTSYQCVVALRANKLSTMPKKQSTHYHLLVQGALYISFVSCFTLTQLVLHYKAPPGTVVSKLLDAFVLPVSGLATARFILHMRSLVDATHSPSVLKSDPLYSTGAALTTLNFSIGQTGTDLGDEEQIESPKDKRRRSGKDSDDVDIELQAVSETNSGATVIGSSRSS